VVAGGGFELMLRTGYFAASGGEEPVIPSWRFVSALRENGHSVEVPENPNRILVAACHTRSASLGTITFNGQAGTTYQAADGGLVVAAISYIFLPTGSTISVACSLGSEAYIGLYEIITARRAPQSEDQRVGTSGTLTSGLSGGEVNAVSIVAGSANNGGNAIGITNSTQTYFNDMNGTGGGPNMGVECRAQGATANGAASMSLSSGGSNNMVTIRQTWFED